jgi:hypothetical protein
LRIPMSPKQLAESYLEIFCSGKGLERLLDILADDLVFEGPFTKTASASEYVDSLIADPPVDCTYRIEKSFEKGEWVNLIYEFSKPGVTTLMSQLFEIRDGRIRRVLLIFDTAKFA